MNAARTQTSPARRAVVLVVALTGIGLLTLRMASWRSGTPFTTAFPLVLMVALAVVLLAGLRVGKSLLSSSRLVTLLAGNGRDVIVRLDTSGRLKYVSQAALSALGYPPDVLEGQELTDLCHPDDVSALRSLLAGPTPPRGRSERVFRLRHADGRWQPNELYFGIGNSRSLGCALRDITPALQSEAIRRTTETRFRLLTENAGDMIVLSRADRTRTYVSPVCYTILGYRPDEMAGQDFLALVHPDEQGGIAAAYDQFCATGGRATSSHRLRRKDGVYVPVEATWVAVPAPPGVGSEVVAIVRDVAARTAAEARIAFLASHDPLTGLANRTLLRERAEDALRRVGRGERIAVICLDLDRFKSINDTMGHAVGDALLRAVGERLSAGVREVDTVARLGGDEFTVLQVGIARAQDITILTSRLLDLLDQPYEIAGQHFRIGASFGAALAPTDGTSFETLLRKAELALYRAKAEERGTWRVYDREMDAGGLAHEQLGLDLAAAMERGEFLLHYMPLVAIDDGRITGFEALLRWRHSQRGMIGPSEFIPIAEETGLIVALGAWVLSEACIEAAGWPEGVRVAVNLSPVQLRSSKLLKMVAETLERSGLAAHRLELEITESVFMPNDSATLKTLLALRNLGVRIAIDDFGTGYSSLRYLRSFPFDRIKLDRSFVQDLADAEGGVVIVRAVAGLGRNLGIPTLAEGVETMDQLECLRSEGYNEAQGFHFGRPAGPEATRRLLTQNGRQAALNPSVRSDSMPEDAPLAN